MYNYPWGRRAIKFIWTTVADESVVIPNGPLEGWRFAAGGGQPGYLLGSSEPEVQAALVRSIRSGDVVYDVGANVGFITLLAARLVAPSGHVYSFEPMDVNIRALRRNIDLNAVKHVDVVTVAVSNTDGTALMSLGDDQATGHLQEAGEDLVRVPSMTIDSFVAAGHSPPDLVKIDVEGAEDLVLAGMSETLRRVRPRVIFELHYGDDDPRRDVIKALLADAAYDELELPLDGGSMAHVLATPREIQDKIVHG